MRSRSWKVRFFLTGRQRTLKRVFSENPGSIPWRKLDSMLQAFGVKTTTTPGDSTYVPLGRANGVDLVIHEGMAEPSAVRMTRDLLEAAGIAPGRL